ncbi:MAG: class I SAM-dependent methyltransferase [Magnetospirillum sp.]|jgi:SAM-dependent methyltransferase|nr:class I SAM-dependent methyltransferase [Magnetospirillum sp.]
MEHEQNPATDWRQRFLARYVSTHAAVSDAAGNLDRRWPFLQQFVGAHFPPDKSAKIVDLGCGHGAIVWAAQRLGYTAVSGVDASPEQVAMAATLKISGVRQGDLMAELRAMPGDSLDAIVLFDLYHYFDPATQLRLADEVRRVLKPGGRFILHLPNGEALFSGRVRYWDIMATGSFTRRSIEQLLLVCDFKNVACFEDKPVVHGLKSAVRGVLWRCVRFVLRLALAAETGETGGDAIFSQTFVAVAHK